ncbi:DUF262 domain-containing protein [Thalassotalea sp. HSM 43]|uniref:DUF262 domain-containing protein n=1 Tax=Thalassotalea sp. HSM 43 TaxID=2552945 RepID=UPI001081B188|nr:DUF262 domain-containing protein [Thalassotalea sp. HSM 43]QBY05145.1 DUF262 domain-containing protein [Thalassotalea sp. HSM 43]
MNINLVQGEKLELGDGKIPEVTMSDDEINKKYLDGEIRIVTEQARYPLNAIASMVKNTEEYKMNPEYQRRHRWSNEKRSALIESLIMNVPLPPIFLYEYDYSCYEVMDGLQRLTAISSFYENEFALEGLTKWPELNTKRYHELPEKVQKGIDRRYISAIILLKETAKTEVQADQLKQMVFDRINSGGEKLEPQEKRNANFDGKLNKLCIKLSENESLSKTWGIPPHIDGANGIHTERAANKLFKTMYDVELVLRFFAYRQKHELHSGSLESYLDRYLEQGNYFEDEVRNALADLFNQTIDLAYELFGEQAFYMYRERQGKWAWYERATVAIYDPMMLVLSQNLDNRVNLIAAKTDIQAALEEFYQTNYDAFGGRNVNEAALKEREELLANFIARFI